MFLLDCGPPSRKQLYYSNSGFFFGLVLMVIGARISGLILWVGFLMVVTCAIQTVCFLCLYCQHGWRVENESPQIPAFAGGRLQEEHRAPTVIYVQDTGSGPVVVAQVQGGQIPSGNFNMQPFQHQSGGSGTGAYGNGQGQQHVMTVGQPMMVQPPGNAGIYNAQQQPPFAVGAGMEPLGAQPGRPVNNFTQVD